MSLRYLLSAAGIVFSVLLSAQSDREIVEDYLKKNDSKNAGESMIYFAKRFIDRPYVAATLEINDDEQLVVNMKELDCTTLVETVTALTLTANEGKSDYESFEKNLTLVRYRNGIIDGYLSRLHYSSDWIFDNLKKGIIEDVTKSAGKEIMFDLNFMSTHPDSYKYLKNHREAIPETAKIERQISERTYYYIPKEEIKTFDGHYRNGDIIMFLTSVPGLDFSHMGIFYRDGGKSAFIHASSKYEKVLINPESLYDYCKAVKSNKGVVILRIAAR